MKHYIDIYEMLRWDNNEEIQQKGIEYASKEKDLLHFIQPHYLEYGSNIWDNCAKIIAKKSDEELKIYLTEILGWIADMNWVGADTILQRLWKFDAFMLKYDYEKEILKANNANDMNWIAFLSYVLDENKKLKNILSRSCLEIIEENAKKLESYE